mmetsp:Transcript_15049/g.41382  ORF Transcript_15049/g.41382 Transcript_15049/m.41382 type:complete len:302 (-) Transcript_15049:244-1149(-)
MLQQQPLRGEGPPHGVAQQRGHEAQQRPARGEQAAELGANQRVHHEHRQQRERLAGGLEGDRLAELRGFRVRGVRDPAEGVEGVAAALDLQLQATKPVRELAVLSPEPRRRELVHAKRPRQADRRPLLQGVALQGVQAAVVEGDQHTLLLKMQQPNGRERRVDASHRCVGRVVAAILRRPESDLKHDLRDGATAVEEGMDLPLGEAHQERADPALLPDDPLVLHLANCLLGEEVGVPGVRAPGEAAEGRLHGVALLLRRRRPHGPIAVAALALPLRALLPAVALAPPAVRGPAAAAAAVPP